MNELLKKYPDVSLLRKLVLSACIVLFLFDFSFAQTTYYISNSYGNDANNGTSPATPWKTVNKVNAMYNLFAAGDSVLFMSGDVFYGSLTISGRTGNSSNPITFSSYGLGNLPIIRASQPVTGWTVYSGNIWKATLSKLSKQVWNGSAFVPYYFRTPSLFINNIRQRLGREPDYNATDGGFRTISSHTANNLTINEATSLPYPVNQFQGAEVTIRTNREYFKTETVTSQSGSSVNITATNVDPNVNTIMDNFGYFFQNNVNTLNLDGEWCHDTTASKLYLSSAIDPNTRSIEVPLYPSSLIINNSSYLRIIGLQLENASDNTVAGQNDDNITIANCYINNSNLYGSYIFQITNSSFINNTIVNCNNSGLRLELCSGITISGNTIKNVGMWAGMGDQGTVAYIGLRLITNATGNNSTINNNLLDSIGYDGVNMAGYGIVVPQNEIRNFCLVKDDGGGIYSATNTYPAKIYQNFVHDAPGAPFGAPAGSQLKPAGIYTDNGSQNQEAYNNSIYNIGYWGILANLSSNNSYHDNTIFNCNGTALSLNTYPNTLGPGATAYTALYNNVKRNIFFPRVSTQRCADYDNSLNPPDLTSNLGSLDSNYYCQPYNGGSEIQVLGSSTTNYVLSQFKTAYPAYEVHGNPAPYKLNPSDNPSTYIRFIANPTSSAVAINLGAFNYVDAKGTVYTGSVSVPAFGSLGLIGTSGSVAYQSPAPQTVGAIRWDAWTGSANSVGVQVEKDLGPNQFHYRLPFYATEVSANTVKINACAQSIMDQEIAYAVAAGLDYWAFVWYPASTGLDQSRKLYKSSSYKQAINYCLIIEPNNWVTNISLDSIVSDFKCSNYQKVLGNRPLLYLLGYTGILKQDVDTLRARTIRAGLGTPYIVLMRQDAVLTTLTTLGLDAFSLYATSWLGGGITYDSLAHTDIAQWNWTGVSNNLPTVPHVTTGWDDRPRNLNPVTWQAQPPATAWVQQATPTQIANHIVDAKNWNVANPTVATANTVIIYAWNEFDEGGWLCPNLANYGGAARIIALGSVLGCKILPP